MRRLLFWIAAMALPLSAWPAAAQIQTVDPNSAMREEQIPPPGADDSDAPVDSGEQYPGPDPSAPPPPIAPADAPPPPAKSASARQQAAQATYGEEDLVGAAEGLFGKGTVGLAGILENVLRDQGRPNAYIAGREAAGAFVLGLRYGSGKLFHKIEGQRDVFWTGPSVGFDVGGDADKVFVLVYNLHDSQELYRRFPSGEGRVYFVGGFSASYLRRGDVVLIPVRLGVGWRLGANVGYMKFSEKSRWLPF